MSEWVTLRRAADGTADRYGDVTTARTDVTLEAFAVYPRTSSEFEEPGRDRVTDGLTAEIPVGTVVDPRRDLFVVRGNTYEVDGEPGDYRSPWTSWRVLVVNLTRVKG